MREENGPGMVAGEGGKDKPQLDMETKEKINYMIINPLFHA